MQARRGPRRAGKAKETIGKSEQQVVGGGELAAAWPGVAWPRLRGSREREGLSKREMEKKKVQAGRQAGFYGEEKKGRGREEGNKEGRCVP